MWSPGPLLPRRARPLRTAPPPVSAALTDISAVAEGTGRGRGPGRMTLRRGRMWPASLPVTRRAWWEWHFCRHD